MLMSSKNGSQPIGWGASHSQDSTVQIRMKEDLAPGGDLEALNIGLESGRRVEEMSASEVVEVRAGRGSKPGGSLGELAGKTTTLRAKALIYMKLIHWKPIAFDFRPPVSCGFRCFMGLSDPARNPGRWGMVWEEKPRVVSRGSFG